MSLSRSIVFVVPTNVSTERGPVAAWLNTAGWVSAASALGYDTTVLTPHGLLDANALRRKPQCEKTTPKASSWAAAHLPAQLKVAVKDGRELLRAKRFSSILRERHFEDGSVRFVWQRHELFHAAGLQLAERLGCPFVLYVPAPKVWEAQHWGLERPGWGWAVERFGEKALLRSADVVACVSDEVGEAVSSMGVDDERVLITPSTVDTSLFVPLRETECSRRRLGISGRFVIGWTGSFRRFHGLEVLIDALQEVREEIPEALLMLVGGGPEKAQIAARVADRRLDEWVRFVDTVDQHDLPTLLAACDVTVFLGRPDQAFHYSPLKLWEYLAMGLPVVAAAEGSTARMLTNGENALLVRPGDTGSLARAIARLRNDASLREQLGSNARILAERESWESQLRRVLKRLHRIEVGS